MNVADAIPSEWADKLTGGPIGIGYDVATTTKGQSNPSALTVTERVSPLVVERLNLRWKTDDPDVAIAIIDRVLDHIAAAQRRPRRLAIDASNEKYFARRVQAHLAGRLPVELVVSGASVEWRGETFSYKVLLGNLYVESFVDNVIAIAPETWLKDDRRLVQRDRGSFVTPVGKDGGHGDTFDSGKLGLWALESGGGPVSASGVSVGASNALGSSVSAIRNLRSPLARKLLRKRRASNS